MQANAQTTWQQIHELDIWQRAKHDFSVAHGESLAPTTVWPYPNHPVDTVADVSTATEFNPNPSEVSVAGFWQSKTSSSYFKGFEPRGVEGPAVRIGQHQVGFDWQVQINYLQTEEINQQQRWAFDQSWLEKNTDNWVLGIGSLPRWWGPGWDSSLILSANAQTSPSIYLSRSQFTAFSSPWLNWIGPWHVITFMSRLENHRDHPHTLLWGARATLKPFNSLEIGMSRTALWAGDGRPSSINVFSDLLLGNDNTSSSDEPGDQLGGFDAKYTHMINQQVYACYTQLIGEDEAGGLPSKYLGQVGCSLQLPVKEYLLTQFIEYSDTAADSFSQFGSDIPAYNVAYEHHLYANGYRYRQRAIGSQYDNDSRSLVLGWLLQPNIKTGYKLVVRDLDLNRDDRNLPAPSGNTVSSNALPVIQWQIGLTQSWQHYTLGVDYFYNSKVSDQSLITKHSCWLMNLSVQI